LIFDHSKYLKHCFELAKKGKGYVSPNPLVGAVLVKNGKVIGIGFHKKYGTAHAEVDAINHAKENVAGSTLYCNLEPCCHTNKQTPPCVPLIIEKKVKRVVISNLDPNPNVNGIGVSQLRKAGIEVSTGILKEEGEELNKFYFKSLKNKRPYIALKIAQSIDGKISRGKKEQTWLTGKKSQKFVHELRSLYDAVLIGANTVKIDNPLLTVREVQGRNPLRIIIDGKLSSPLNSKIFNSNDSNKTWIFTSEKADRKKIEQLKERGIKIFTIKQNGTGLLNIKTILNTLARNKITSILVEGGAKVFSQFINSGLYDEIIVLQAPVILGEGLNVSKISRIKELQLLGIERLDNDIKLVYGKKLSH